METFLQSTVYTYLRYLNTLLLYQEQQLERLKFQILLLVPNTQSRLVEEEGYSCSREVRRYHAYLCGILDSTCLKHPNLSDVLELQLSDKACNDKAGPAGVVPSFLFFGFIPVMPVCHEHLVKNNICGRRKLYLIFEYHGITN